MIHDRVIRWDWQKTRSSNTIKNYIFQDDSPAWMEKLLQDCSINSSINTVYLLNCDDIQMKQLQKGIMICIYY